MTELPSERDIRTRQVPIETQLRPTLASGHPSTGAGNPPIASEHGIPPVRVLCEIVIISFQPFLGGAPLTTTEPIPVITNHRHHVSRKCLELAPPYLRQGLSQLVRINSILESRKLDLPMGLKTYSCTPFGRENCRHEAKKTERRFDNLGECPEKMSNLLLPRKMARKYVTGQ
ncbi:hypothetical protein E4U56_000377 [Claviceps arundinis]|uniref:Uncharacterized protein n=1 Tax=Claviceps arundinis TaxID=1623583 RepID=A0A9P7MSU1_9HYPO|nr:hypothetical protein E4U56_000377 [Claviceps arundinis]